MCVCVWMGKWQKHIVKHLNTRKVLNEYRPFTVQWVGNLPPIITSQRSVAYLSDSCHIPYCLGRHINYRLHTPRIWTSRTYVSLINQQWTNVNVCNKKISLFPAQRKTASPCCRGSSFRKSAPTPSERGKRLFSCIKQMWKNYKNSVKP